MLTIIAVTHVGIKNTKFAPCAICCSIFKKAVNKYINTVPPPHTNTAYKS